MTEIEFLHKVEECGFEPIKFDRGHNWIVLCFPGGIFVEYIYGSDVVRVININPHRYFTEEFKKRTQYRWKSKFDDGHTDGPACDIKLEWNSDYLCVKDWHVLHRFLRNFITFEQV